MCVTTDDQSDVNELALAHAISELKRQQHNMKIAQRKKAEQDALFAVEQAAYREDIEEARQDIVRLLERHPALAQQYQTSLTHLLEPER